jgi:ankyrin repeat protein
MLENVIEILLSSDFYRDIIPIMLINQEFYNNPYLWNKIVNRTYYKSKTLLMMYAINNNLPRSRFLIEAGTNLDLVDSENRSAMIYALAGNAENAPHQCKQCNLAIIEEMCKKQINLDIIDNDKETAIFYALRMKHFDALNILCKYNFNVNYKNKDGITYKYTNRMHMNKTKRLKYQRLIKNYKDIKEITPIENKLSDFNSNVLESRSRIIQLNENKTEDQLFKQKYLKYKIKYLKLKNQIN